MDGIAFVIDQVLGEGHVTLAQRLLQRVGAKPVDVHHDEVARHPKPVP